METIKPHSVGFAFILRGLVSISMIYNHRNFMDLVVTAVHSGREPWFGVPPIRQDPPEFIIVGEKLCYKTSVRENSHQTMRID